MIKARWTLLDYIGLSWPSNSQEFDSLLCQRSSLIWKLRSSVTCYALWAIWKDRNSLIFEGKSSLPNIVARSAIAAAEEFDYIDVGQLGWAGVPGSFMEPTTNLTEWMPPPPGVIKVNFALISRGMEPHFGSRDGFHNNQF